MSAARELANFLTGVSPSDLPAQAMDHAAWGNPQNSHRWELGSGSTRGIPRTARNSLLTPVGSSWRGLRPRSTPAPLETCQ